MATITALSAAAGSKALGDSTLDAVTQAILEEFAERIAEVTKKATALANVDWSGASKLVVSDTDADATAPPRSVAASFRVSLALRDMLDSVVAIAKLDTHHERAPTSSRPAATPCDLTEPRGRRTRRRRDDQVLVTLSKRQDLVLAMMLVCVVFMMILPLPTDLVDLLIAINLMLAAMLLMVAMYIKDVVQLSAFPSILLLTTLFRLAISISTTRLILLHGDAGHIVATFGKFVIGGNLVVGMVVFLILTIVNFMVITKGSERVAEVSARFSLDSMPGKQMSIDSDMRAGQIEMDEAKRRRTKLEKESQLYGAMDGAMKFVKGDAIASIIIIFVNLIGGMTIGMLQRGMPANEAMQLYALLSIGDGLIAQIRRSSSRSPPASSSPACPATTTATSAPTSAASSSASRARSPSPRW